MTNQANTTQRGLVAVILAAGKGTRMQSDLPKVMHPVLGRPMVHWVVDAALAAGATKTVLVIGHDFVQRQGLDRFEYPVLVILSVIGMMIMVSSGDLMALYMGLELQSLSLYVIAAFRRAGADLEQAVLGQSLISDPVDKVITLFVVYLILGAMSTRAKARFPQGEYLLPLGDTDGAARRR